MSVILMSYKNEIIKIISILQKERNYEAEISKLAILSYNIFDHDKVCSYIKDKYLECSDYTMIDYRFILINKEFDATKIKSLLYRYKGNMLNDFIDLHKIEIRDLKLTNILDK